MPCCFELRSEFNNRASAPRTEFKRAIKSRWRRSQLRSNWPLVGGITGNFEFRDSKSASAPRFFPDYGHFSTVLAILGTANLAIHNSEFEISNSEKALDRDVPRQDEAMRVADRLRAPCILFTRRRRGAFFSGGPCDARGSSQFISAWRYRRNAGLTPRTRRTGSNTSSPLSPFVKMTAPSPVERSI
jgi:hypothetical protein